MWRYLRLRLERVLEPLDAAVAHDDHVEAHPAGGELAMPLQEQRGSERDAPLFAPPDARGGATEVVTRARAHFRDHEQEPAASDHVELTDAAQIVARHDREALGFEKSGGGVLGECAG